MHDSHFIDPQVRPMLDMMAAHYGDYSKMSLEEVRAVFAKTATAMARPLPKGCEDGYVDIPGPAGAIRCRYFRPVVRSGSLPVIIQFIPGTYVATALDQVGHLPPALAMAVNAVVLTPLHRMPPENPFPAAFDDCFAVYAHVLRHADQIGGDGARVVLLGESSGGTLAAATCLEARDKGLPQPLLQVLAEPLVDHDSETPSVNEFSYVLSKADLRKGSRYYFGDAPAPLRASPLRACSLSGVAPAYIVTAGLDPLRDEGIAFAARLREEGVIVAHRHHDGQVHGFFSMVENVTQAKIAFRECCAVISLAMEGGLSVAARP